MFHFARVADILLPETLLYTVEGRQYNVVDEEGISQDCKRNASNHGGYKKRWYGVPVPGTNQLDLSDRVKGNKSIGTTHRFFQTFDSFGIPYSFCHKKHALEFVIS